MPKPYVSCIKIQGIPILPPLMTEQKRLEIKAIRLKVDEVEKRIESRKHERNSQNAPNKSTINNESVMVQSIEHQLAFANEEELPLDRPRIHLRKSEVERLHKLPDHYSFYESDANENYLSKENITECQADCVENCCNPNVNECTTSNVDETFSVPNETTNSDEKHIGSPRLIRSNSYILETPSPLLLAYLNKQENVTDMTTNTRETIERNQDTCEQELSNKLSQKESNIIDEVIENNFTPRSSQIKLSDAAEIKLKQILNNIPTQYSEEILAIFDNVKSQSADLRTRRSTCLSEDNDATFFDDGKASYATLSQTLFYSESGSNETLNDHSTINYNHTMSLQTLPKKFLNVERDKDRAASTINAGVRGYMIRRLMRTDKVQSLKETIKDAVVCAIELHGVDDIMPSDVELHRRLLQQVSAAHCAFYEIFFDLTTCEQMSIIRQDRQKKLDKMNRSASSLSKSCMSTPRPASAQSRNARKV